MITKSQLKYLRSLHQKKSRENENVYLAEGNKIVEEAIASHYSDIKLLVYTPGNKLTVKSNLHKKNIPVAEVKPEEFEKVSILKNPQGVLVVLQKPVIKQPLAMHSDKLILVLDTIRDPGNLGTIIRLADWFGIGNIFCSEDTVECYNPKVVQATMGAILRVNIHYTSLKELLLNLRSLDYTIYGSTLNGENIYKKSLSIPAAVILGNETRGISSDLIPMIKERILIPNFSTSANRTESLNVSIAAAIICSEFSRLTI